MKVVYESCTPEEWKRKYDAALKAVGYEVIEETDQDRDPKSRERRR